MRFLHIFWLWLLFGLSTSMYGMTLLKNKITSVKNGVTYVGNLFNVSAQLSSLNIKHANLTKEYNTLRKNHDCLLVIYAQVLSDIVENDPSRVQKMLEPQDDEKEQIEQKHIKKLEEIIQQLQQENEKLKDQLKEQQSSSLSNFSSSLSHDGESKYAAAMHNEKGSSTGGPTSLDFGSSISSFGGFQGTKLYDTSSKETDAFKNTTIGPIKEVREKIAQKPVKGGKDDYANARNLVKKIVKLFTKKLGSQSVSIKIDDVPVSMVEKDYDTCASYIAAAVQVCIDSAEGADEKCTQDMHLSTIKSAIRLWINYVDKQAENNFMNQDNNRQIYKKQSVLLSKVALDELWEVAMHAYGFPNYEGTLTTTKLSDAKDRRNITRWCVFAGFAALAMRFAPPVVGKILDMRVKKAAIVLAGMSLLVGLIRSV